MSLLLTTAAAASLLPCRAFRILLLVVLLSFFFSPSAGESDALRDALQERRDKKQLRQGRAKEEKEDEDEAKEVLEDEDGPLLEAKFYRRASDEMIEACLGGKNFVVPRLRDDFWE